MPEFGAKARLGEGQASYGPQDRLASQRSNEAEQLSAGLSAILS